MDSPIELVIAFSALHRLFGDAEFTQLICFALSAAAREDVGWAECRVAYWANELTPSFKL